MSAAMEDAPNVSGFHSNSTFNPYTQDLVILMPDGVTPVFVSIGRVFELQHLATTTCIIYGVEMGISIVMLLVILLMTKPEKRRTSVFILNIVATLLVFVRSIVQCVTIFGPHWNFYNWSLAYSPTGKQAEADKAQSLTAEILAFLILVAVESSMLVQTLTVTNMLKTRFRTPTNISCILVAAVTITVRFAAMVLNAMWSILRPASRDLGQLDIIAKMAKAYNSCTIGSIIFFSAIFCAKLGEAIRKRRGLGLKQFGPIQVIFVMGCQTLLIPAIFGILSYWVLQYAPLSTMMLCIVTTFLPLSSIWASTKADGRNNNIAAPNQWHNEKLRSKPPIQFTNHNSEKELLPSTINSTLVDSSTRGDSFSGSASKKMQHFATASHDSIDLELASLGHGDIKVKSTYTVRPE